jgi:uncharacterized protein (TIGR00730 family)
MCTFSSQSPGKRQAIMLTGLKVMGRQQDEVFLGGPESAARDLLRLARIMGQFLKGFRELRRIGPCITFFGSARFSEDHRYYQLARAAAREAGSRGFSVMTGGGPGVMEAANRGAKDVSALSIGCNIELSSEQKPNPYLDISSSFQHFFVRKVMLVRYSQAFIILPGGFGTMDEIFETATLVQTGKVRRFPIVLLGADYWTELIDFVRHKMVSCGTIGEFDLDSLVIFDDPFAALEHIISVIDTQQPGSFTASGEGAGRHLLRR